MIPWPDFCALYRKGHDFIRDMKEDSMGTPAPLDSERLCAACKKLVDNYGRCRTPNCERELGPQHKDITWRATWRKQ